MEKLNMNSNVLFAVVIDDTFIGIAKDEKRLPSMLKTYMDDNHLTTEYMTESVKLYPVLSAEPIEVMFEVEREYTVESDLGRYTGETYLIEDIDEEFDSESELQDFIRNALEDGDYDEEDVNDWTIKFVDKRSVIIEIGQESVEIKVLDAERTVSDYVKDDVEDLVAELQEFEDVSVPMTEEPSTYPKMFVDADHEDLSYVTSHGAKERVREGKYVYIMDGNKGTRTYFISEVGDAIEQGKTFARLINE